MKDVLDWLYEHYFLTTLIVIVGISLFVAITLKVFFAPVDIPSGTVAAYGTFFAIFGASVALWKWRRGKDEVNNDNSNSE